MQRNDTGRDCSEARNLAIVHGWASPSCKAMSRLTHSSLDVSSSLLLARVSTVGTPAWFAPVDIPLLGAPWTPEDERPRVPRMDEDERLPGATTFPTSMAPTLAVVVFCFATASFLQSRCLGAGQRR